MGVVQKGLRPGIPPGCPPALGALMEACWAQSPAARPSFRELTPRLQLLLDAARDEDARRTAAANIAKPSGGLLSKFRSSSKH